MTVNTEGASQATPTDAISSTQTAPAETTTATTTTEATPVAAAVDGAVATETQPETKIEETTKPDTEVVPPKEEQAKEISLVKPEGSPLSDEDVEEVKAFAKEHGLNEAAAQAVLEQKSKAFDDASLAVLEQAEVNKQNWRVEIEAHPTLGGANLEKTARVAKAVLDQFASKELNETLEKSGLGNYPQLLEFLNAVGDEMKIVNDSYVKEGTAGNTTVGAAKTLYPNLK